MAKTLPNIILAGLDRYQNPPSRFEEAKKAVTRERRIERLLNKYASAKITFGTFNSPHFNWNRWDAEFKRLYKEAKDLVYANGVARFYVQEPNPLAYAWEGWENDHTEDEISKIAKNEYVCWTNNPCRPWNSGDNEHEYNHMIRLLAYLAQKPCYNILYDHS